MKSKLFYFNALGIDLTYFGIIMIFNKAIGFITPPVGLNLFVATSIAKKSSSA